jgi:MFS family permease
MSATVASEGPRLKLLTALQIRDFRSLWTGMSVSLIGDGIFLVALAWQVYSLSNAPSALAVVSIAMTLPQALLVLLGGVISDHFDKRRVMIASDIVRGLAIGAIGALAISGHLRIWHMLVLAAVYGCASAFFLPAFDGFIPDIVPSDQLAEANALDQFVRPTALRLIGPALGGFIVAGASAGGAFVIDAATFAVSAIAVLRVAHRPAAPAKIETARMAMQEFREGYRYVRSQTWLWATLFSASLAYLLFTGPADILLPYLVKNTMHGSPTLLGIVLAFGGLGALLAAALMGQRGLPRRNMTFIYVTWTIATVAVAGYGFATVPWHLMAACFLFHAFDAAGLVVWTTTRHTLVPPEMRGRVGSFRAMAFGLWPLSYALTAPVVSLVGVQATLIGAGVGGAAVTLAFLYLPGMRDMEREGWLQHRLAEPEYEPERDVTGQMAGLYRFAKMEVVRRRGTLDLFAGDAVTATFDTVDPSAGHCLQALETALALREEAAALRLPLALAVTVGAAESNIAARETSTTLAARLQQAAADGEILLSEEAHRLVHGWLVEHRLAVERHELALNGFAEPQVVFKLPARVRVAPQPHDELELAPAAAAA